MPITDTLPAFDSLPEYARVSIRVVQRTGISVQLGRATDRAYDLARKLARNDLRRALKLSTTDAEHALSAYKD